MKNEGHKYAGVTLDWYDDQGLTLKDKFPTKEQLPELIKQADVRAKDSLPNEAFALVMVDSGHVFRKFACHDPGTTAMSTIYFMEHGDKLPEGAQKVAAAKLVNACVDHGLMPPAAMTKVATADLLSGGLADNKPASEYDARQMSMGEKVELEHTNDPAKSREIAKDHLEEIPDYYTRLDKMESEAEKNANVIDITGKLPKPIVKKASLSDDDYALVLPDGTRRYPINSWDMVKKAEVYFQENGIRMAPEHRRQYATKLAQKAFILGYPLDEDITSKGARSYHSDGMLKSAVEMRKSAVEPGYAREFLDELLEKHAEVHPEVFAECLRRFDVDQGLDVGWDKVVLNPWESTFGIDKRAEVVWEEGADRVTDAHLRNLAENRKALLMDMYGDDMVEEFIKDPVGVFNSMPAPEKKIIARMADDIASSGGTEAAIG